MTRVLFCALILITFAAAGCKKTPSQPMTQQQTPAINVQSPNPGKEKGPAAIQAEKKPVTETYLYNPQGRRDPFFSIIEASKKERETERKKKGLRPAEAFDVADIILLAIAWDKNAYYAMVQMPDNKYFTIKEGSHLGIYGGKVIRIDSGSVVVREYVKTYKGDIQPKDTILRLRKEGEK